MRRDFSLGYILRHQKVDSSTYASQSSAPRSVAFAVPEQGEPMKITENISKFPIESGDLANL